MLFEFEDDSYGDIKKISKDAYDVDLAIALSNSIKCIPGEQILSPFEVQKIISERIMEILHGE